MNLFFNKFRKAAFVKDKLMCGEKTTKKYASVPLAE